jgi:hypothetical protein
MKLTSVAIAALLCLRAAASPAGDMAAAARNFLAALNDDQRSKAAFTFESEERDNWHFVPASARA